MLDDASKTAKNERIKSQSIELEERKTKLWNERMENEEEMDEKEGVVGGHGRSWAKEKNTRPTAYAREACEIGTWTVGAPLQKRAATRCSRERVKWCGAGA